MAENTAISWANHTFNPWIGCTKVSPACDGCYAEAQMGMPGRFGPARVQWGAPGQGEGTRSRTAPSTWAKVKKWDREAAAAIRAWEIGDPGFPQVLPVYRGPGAGPKPSTFVFCASLADVFDNAVPTEWRRDLFDLIRATPNLTWLLLTKRPGNIVKLFEQVLPEAIGPDDEEGEWYLPDMWPRNAAIGCTVVTQEEADRDIPKLLAAKAALNPAFAFLSMEPLLGPVDLSAHLWGRAKPCAECPRDADCGCGWYPRGAVPNEAALDWIITGGETDQGAHKARPSHPDWFRSLRDQCAAAGVPFHHKQNGEWAPCPANDGGWWPVGEEKFTRLEANGEQTYDGWPMQKVGKKTAGRLLDGVTHDARPEVRA